jgi:hypothetical protein
MVLRIAEAPNDAFGYEIDSELSCPFGSQLTKS